MSDATGPRRGPSRGLTTRGEQAAEGCYTRPASSHRLSLLLLVKGTWFGSGVSSSRREPLPLLALGVPDLNLRDRMNLPDGRSPVPHVLDVLIVVQEPPCDADSPLTLAKIEERLIGPAGRRGLERGGHLRDDLLVP